MKHQDHHDRLAAIRARRDDMIAAANRAHAQDFAESTKAHAERIEQLRSEISRQAALAAVLTEPRDRAARELAGQIQALTAVSDEAAEPKTKSRKVKK